MKLKRSLAVMMSIVMLLTMLPFPGVAADNSISNITETTDGIVLNKSAKLDSDGTYTINLEAFATGKTTTSITTNGIPMDVVLVLDHSGSMIEALNSTPVDKTDPSVQALGTAPGAYVVKSDDTYTSGGITYNYYLTAWYDPADSAWYYDTNTTYTGAKTLVGDQDLYLSRLGALTISINDFVGAILEDTTAYDSYVNHRVAIVGYSAADDGGNSFGIISPGSDENTNNVWANTGLYVNGTLENYSYYASGIADYDPETYMPHYVVGSSSKPVVFYCDNCQGWYTYNHSSSTDYCNYNRGTKYTPKTSASGSGTLFYDIVGHTDQNYKDALVSVNDGKGNLTASISTAISNFGAFGSTNVGYGMDMAKNVFANNPIGADEARKRIVVVFSDGACEARNVQMAIDNAHELTSDAYNATIYSVGLFGANEETAEIKSFMHAISSNYPSATYNGSSYTFGQASWIPVYELDANGSYYIQTGTNGSYTDFTPITYSNRTWYDQNNNKITTKTSKDDAAGTQVYVSHYMSASNASALNSIFTSIATTATSASTSVTLDKYAVMKDVLNPGLFELSEDYQVSISTQAVTTADDSTYTAGAVKNFTTTDGITYTNGDEKLTLTVDKQTNSIAVTGFDYAEKYVSSGHPGEKLIVTLTGVKALDAAATGGYVYTNEINTSGIYDGGYIVAAFPKPQVMIACKSFVLDYAKQVNFSAADLGLTQIKDICVNLAEFDAQSMDVSAKEQKLKYGTMAYSSGSAGTFTYVPLTTDWSSYDSFYVFGLNTAGDYEWIRVSVMPANNVYYEDDFTTSTDSGTVGIVYSGNWTVEGTSNSNTETPNGDIHGWESQLADDKGYSNGTSHIASAAGACATFTFTGTGVDIYSRTNMTTGMIFAILSRATEDSTADANKDGFEDISNMILMVDNLAASGDYYQIPTLSIHTIFDSATGQEIDMPYGTYKLQLMVSTAHTMDADGNLVLDDSGNPAVRSTYYLDGIRVYNPLQGCENDSIVSGAYGDDELNAVFTEVRDLLIDAGSFGEPTDSTEPSAAADTTVSGDYSGKYYITTIRSSGNYFYMTSDLGTASTKRYQAVDSGLTTLPAQITEPADGYVFVLEKNDDGTYCICVDGVADSYLGWTSGNSGTLVAKDSALALTVDLADGIYNIHFTASDAERYLSLNNTSGNNYFAWYKGTQKQNLVLIPVASGDGTHTHSYTAEITTAATCVAAGVKTFTCSCGDSYTEEIPATGAHNYVDGVCSVCGAAQYTATLVTDVTTLQAGEQILIVAKDYAYAMGAESSSGNNRIQAPVTFNDDGTMVTYTTDAQIITLADGTTTGTFAFDAGEKGYLYAASSSSNYLKTTVSLTANASWSIGIDADTGIATIVAQGTNTHNVMRYNATYGLFACYLDSNAASQKNIYIYRIENLDSGESGGDTGDSGDTEKIAVTGFVFIDQVADKSTGENVNVIGTYETYGPKNEVYLAPGQSIVFRVNSTSDCNYYVGLKAPELDDPETADVDESQVTVRYSGYGGVDKTIAHSTDLYYKLTPNSDGYVVIMNVSGGILSITKLRTTSPSASGLMLMTMREVDMLEQVTLLSMAHEDSSAPTNPEVTPDVEIENPSQKPNEFSWLDALIEDLFKSLLNWFRS